MAVTGDIYYVEARLKEIDPDYFLVRRGDKVEVHHTGQIGSTYALTVPYDCLDARTVELVRATRAERAAGYLSALEENNRAVEKRKLSAAVDRAAVAAERAYKETGT